MLADKNTEFMVDVPSYPQRTDFPTTPTIFSSELLEEYTDQVCELGLGFLDLLKFVENRMAGDFHVGRIPGQPNISFLCKRYDELKDDHLVLLCSTYEIELNGICVFSITDDYKSNNSYIHYIDKDKKSVDGEYWIDMLSRIPEWIEKYEEREEKRNEIILMKANAARVNIRIRVCPECQEFKPDDVRVEAGMKCSECAYGGS
jgi:hypothetical protein|tara:strand:- start:1440 stop:2048 length:609 start_codon:yes stop_codon:yes gene_type:complete